LKMIVKLSKNRKTSDVFTVNIGDSVVLWVIYTETKLTLTNL
jgi:hypothetical protein